MNNLQIILAHTKQNGLEESDLDEIVYELKSKEGSKINISGIEAQLSYILKQLGPTETMRIIDDLI